MKRRFLKGMCMASLSILMAVGTISVGPMADMFGCETVSAITTVDEEERSITLDEDGRFEAEIAINEGEVEYKFIPDEDGLYYFYTKDAVSSGTLFNEDRKMIASSEYYNSSWNFLIRKELVGGKTYYIRFSDTYGDGYNYYFIVEKIEPVVVTLNEDGRFETEVSLENGEYAQYAFRPVENGEYYFYSEGKYDTRVELYDSQKNNIGSDDESGEDNNFNLSICLNAEETYYIRVIENYGEDSNFSFVAEKVEPIVISLDENGEYESNVAVGKIHDALYKITPDEDGKYYFYSEGDENTYGELLDSEYKSIVSDDNSYINNNFLIEYDLKGGKTYYIRVEEYDWKNAEFTFKAEKKEDISNATVSFESKHCTYTGDEIIPAVTLKFGDKLLTEGVDFNIENDGVGIEAGVYSMNIEGIGKYYGEIVAEWYIDEVKNYEIEVIDGTLIGTNDNIGVFQEKEVVTVVGSTEKGGWYKNGKLVSANRYYSFYAFSSGCLKWRADDADAAEKKKEGITNVTISPRVLNSNGKTTVTITSNWNLPKGAEEITAGTYRCYVAEGENIPSAEQMVANGSFNASKLKTNKGTFYFNINMRPQTAAKTLCVVSYVAYTLEGNAHTIISDVVTSGNVK